MGTYTSIFVKMTIQMQSLVKRQISVLKALYKVAKESDGEMSGEHGIGYARKDYCEDFYGTDYVKLMSRVKLAFDPNLILNPNKIFPVYTSDDAPELVEE